MKSKKIRKKIAELQVKLRKQLFKEEFEVQAKDECFQCGSKDWSHDHDYDLITCNHCKLHLSLYIDEDEVGC